MHLFMLPGLGNDRRLFANLERLLVGHLPGVACVHVAYPEPQADESFADYARRLAPQVPTGRPVAFVGMSMGGILAQELARYVKPAAIVLLSTIKSRSELPWYYRLLDGLRITQVPGGAFIKRMFYIHAPLGDGMTDEDAYLFNNMLSLWSDAHVRWGFCGVFSWQGVGTVTAGIPITHIHGTADRVFPWRLIRNGVFIPNGRHFMTVTRAPEIADHLASALQPLTQPAFVNYGN
jgi:surfactin synthase thioesterase subunit